MEEKTIIYIAGNPNAYPVEYYNEKTHAFEGVVPDLLEEFSQQSSFDMIYYQLDEKDDREHLFQNNQVDIISANSKETGSWSGANAITVLHIVQNQENVSYYLSFTDTAPEKLKEELQSYLTEVSQETLNGLFLETALSHPQGADYQQFAAGLSVGILTLAIVLLLVIHRYRKKLKAAQQDIETDETTGLGNIEYLRRYYKQFVSDKNRVLYQLLYFYVDVNRLRKVAGSKETDAFLYFCAVVLQEYTRDTDILASISNYGFVLLKQEYDMKKTEDFLHTILERIHNYSKQYEKSFDVKVSVGIYSLRKQDRDLDEMMFHALQAAQLAAKEEVEYMHFSEKMRQKYFQERQLQERVEEAFSNHEFQLYIQFYVNAENGKIVGGEALSRWNHPQKGVLSPSDFVPLMEQEKMISKLDYYCLEEVCMFLEELENQNVENFFVSCNFSRETFVAVDFAQRVKDIMEKYHFPRELLILEITESTETKDAAQMQQNIVALKEYGISIVLDDFGEGFTSFYDLQKYNVDGVKLDKGLIDRILTTKGKTILKLMIQVGHELQMTILAEGVETEQQAEVLRSMGCDVIQGYFYHFPLPKQEAKRKILEQFID